MRLCPLQGHGSYHPQQTNTGTENQTSQVLGHKGKLNNENTWTQGGEHQTLESVVGAKGGTAGQGRLGRDNMGEKCQM